MGAFKEPHGGELKDLYLAPGRGGREARRGLARLHVLGPHRAPAVRPRAAAERRLLAARRLPGPRRLRARAGRDAAGRRHAVADADHARRHPGLRRRASRSASRSPCATARACWSPPCTSRTAGSPTSGTRPAAVFGTDDQAHPGVRYLLDDAGDGLSRRPAAGHRAADALRLQAPARHARRSCAPASSKLGWRRVVAFQTRNPMHRAHQELTFRAAQAAEANLLIHPVVGMTKPGDVDHFTRVRCYEQLLPTLPRADRRRSACCRWRCAWPARARRSGTRSSARTTAAPTSSSAATTPARATTASGKPFYGPYAAQELFAQHEDELGMAMVPFHAAGLLAGPRAVRAGGRGPSRARPCSTSPAPSCAAACAKGSSIPEWFTLPGGGRGAAPHPPAAAPARASPSSSPASPAPASRRSPTRCWSSCWSWAAAR